MRRTMKKAVAVGLAAATAFSLCACGGGDGSKGGSSKDALEVVIWDNNQQKGLQQICDLFTEETGIKVDVQVKEWDSYWTLLEAGASGGDMPDVFWIMGSPDFAAVDALQQLTDVHEEQQALKAR